MTVNLEISGICFRHTDENNPKLKKQVQYPTTYREHCVLPTNALWAIKGSGFGLKWRKLQDWKNVCSQIVQ